MSNHEPTFMDLLIEAHIDLERQGPGSPRAVMQALSFLGPLDRFQRAADLGCGTGGQTLLLAEQLPGKIVGLDMFPCFVERLNLNARARGLQDRVQGIVGKMEALPFEERSLDLIWSEGAIDNIGFEEGLRHWRGFLREGGCIAVSCPTWLTEERPAAVGQFWSDAGSRLESLERNIETMQRCGYGFIAAFALPEACWTDHYFTPRAQAIEKLIGKYGPCDSVREYAAVNEQEVDLYRKYGWSYGYVFYIGRAV